MSQIKIFDSETVLPDARLTAKAQTLLGFEARYERVRDQLRLLLSVESWGHGTRDTMAASLPCAILSPSNTHSLFSTAMSGPEKLPPPNASRTGSWRNPRTEELGPFQAEQPCARLRQGRRDGTLAGGGLRADVLSPRAEGVAPF